MTLPAINELQQDENQVTAHFTLPADLDAFRGHFPTQPVLPGVIQIDWVMQLAGRCFGLAEPVARDFQVKFSDIIAPGASLSLTLRLDRDARRLTFEYRSNGKRLSSGRVKLAPPP